MGEELLAQPIVPFDARHDRASFHCSVEALDRYFQVQAGQDRRRRIAAVSFYRT
jgi:hypothetical protein